MAQSCDELFMARALELAQRGRGFVEPNPLVGAVLVRDEQIIAEGWHQKFGGPHAEIEALNAAQTTVAGATLYVTLEPCCHFGKTPPCSQAVIAAGIRRVVVAHRDPFPKVAGGGLQQLTDAGIQVELGILETEARTLNAPYLKLIERQRPWVIAKWAMTLDGKLATRTGDSRWISCAASRAIVHQLRGRMDGILVGRGTVEADDPLLTARPAGARVATRIVLDSTASISLDSQLVRTAAAAPVLIVVSAANSSSIFTARCDQLRAAGCEVLTLSSDSPHQRVDELLCELGRRQVTNLLVEGGSRVLGSFFDARAIDEVHVFIAPKIAGGETASSPLAGLGIEQMTDAATFANGQFQIVDGDFYFSGKLKTEN